MKKINYIIITLILVIFITGCTSTSNTVKESDSEPIKIGISETLSGKYADIGNNILKGIKEGIKAKDNNVELILFDNQGDAKKAVDDYYFSKMSGVNIFITAFSHISESVNPLSKEDKIILLYNAMAPEPAKENEYSFRIYADAKLEANAIINLIKNDEKVAFVYVVNPSTEIFLKHINKAKLDLDKYSFDKTETDYKTIIQKLKQKKTENVVIAAYSNNIIQFIKQSKELNYVPKRIIANSDGSDEIILKQVEDYINTEYITIAYGTENIYYIFGKYLGKTLLFGIEECKSKRYNDDDPECLKTTMKNIIIDDKTYVDENGVMYIEPKFYKVQNQNLILI